MKSTINIASSSHSPPTESPELDGIPSQGIKLAREGDTSAAEAAFRRELETSPNSSTAHHNFAVFLSTHNRANEAIGHYRTALRLRPRYPDALRNFGTLLAAERQFHEAVIHLWTAVRLQPAHVPTLCALGEALIAAKRRDEAIPLLRHALRLTPKQASLYNVLGLALFDAGRLDQAEAAFENALQIDAKFVGAHNNLGSLYKAMGRSGEALTCFELALSLDPQSLKTKWNRALTFLSLGDFDRGWEEYECRWARPETPPLKVSAPYWDGSSLTGKRILIHAEQGLGDTVQFIRYARLLKDNGAHVIFRCQSPLMAALKGIEGVDALISESDPIPAVDTHAPLMSLPWLLRGVMKGDIPNVVPYLHADPTLAARRQSQLSNQMNPQELRVGIAWQGNPHHQWDHFRSCKLTDFAPLAEIPGIRLVSLQRGPGVEQIAAFQRRTNGALVVPTEGQQTMPSHLADNVAIMSNMNLIISVDTATAHLAGALGKPTWLALSFIADWRWMVGRDDSPWYPTVRLFRQENLGDWNGPLKNMCRELMRCEKSLI